MLEPSPNPSLKGRGIMLRDRRQRDEAGALARRLFFPGHAAGRHLPPGHAATGLLEAGVEERFHRLRVEVDAARILHGHARVESDDVVSEAAAETKGVELAEFSAVKRIERRGEAGPDAAEQVHPGVAGV